MSVRCGHDWRAERACDIDALSVGACKRRDDFASRWPLPAFHGHAPALCGPVFVFVQIRRGSRCFARGCAGGGFWRRVRRRRRRPGALAPSACGNLPGVRFNTCAWALRRRRGSRSRRLREPQRLPRIDRVRLAYGVPRRQLSIVEAVVPGNGVKRIATTHKMRFGSRVRGAHRYRRSAFHRSDTTVATTRQQHDRQRNGQSARDWSRPAHQDYPVPGIKGTKLTCASTSSSTPLSVRTRSSKRCAPCVPMGITMRPSTAS